MAMADVVYYSCLYVDPRLKPVGFVQRSEATWRCAACIT